jgi:outer membrane protein
MKRILFILFMLPAVAIAQQQKFAYINSKEILDKIPAFKEAQKTLDDLSEKWQKEVEAALAEAENKRKAYQEERILLPEDIQRKREEEIAALEKSARDLQKAKFGVNGELFQKRQELIKPIQDKMYKALKTVSQDKYTFVFDIANQSNLMYADPKMDISDKVLKEMGY